jgi:hypothetical protein
VAIERIVLGSRYLRSKAEHRFCDIVSDWSRASGSQEAPTSQWPPDRNWGHGFTVGSFSATPQNIPVTVRRIATKSAHASRWRPRAPDRNARVAARTCVPSLRGNIVKVTLPNGRHV